MLSIDVETMWSSILTTTNSSSSISGRLLECSRFSKDRSPLRCKCDLRKDDHTV